MSIDSIEQMDKEAIANNSIYKLVITYKLGEELRNVHLYYNNEIVRQRDLKDIRINCAIDKINISYSKSTLN